MEVDTTNYRPQNFPTTQSKLDSYAKRLDSHENFLKYNYVLNRAELKTTLGDLYEEYVSYCRGSGVVKAYSKVDLSKKIKEIGIEPYKSNDKLKIKVSAKDLAQIAKSFNWVHETDEYYDKESKKKDKQARPDPSGLDAGLSCEEPDKNEEILKKLSDKEKEVQELNEQFEKMRLEFEAYKKQFPPQAPPAAPAPPPTKMKKEILQLIDDSDESDCETGSDCESESDVSVKSNKIAKALKK
jgi:molecular chaperone GrpE (heat shock protein)